MALVPHKITALAESDADGTDGKNIVAGAVVSLYDTDGSAVTLFDDESGSNGSTAKQTDAKGQVVVYVTSGEYDEEVNGSIKRRVTIGGNSPVEVADFAALETLRPVKTGQAFICQERANAKYILQPSGYVAKPGDVTFANGRVGALQIDGDLNIEWFGAVDDNSTDCYQAIQDAITVCESLNPTRGGVVYIPPKSYIVKSVINVVQRGVTIRGSSNVGFANGNGVSEIIGDHNDGAVIRVAAINTQIENLKVNATAARTAGSKGTLTAPCVGVHFEGPDIAGAGGYIQRSVLNNVTISNQPSHGWIMIGENAYSNATDVYTNYNGGHGFAIDRGKLTGRTNESPPGIVDIIRPRSHDNGGHMAVIGNIADTALSAYRILIHNLEGFRNNSDPTQTIDTGDGIDWAVIAYGQNLEFNMCAVGQQVVGSAVGGGMFVAGRIVRVFNTRFIDNDQTIKVGAGFAEPTRDVVIDGFVISGGTPKPTAVYVHPDAEQVKVFSRSDKKGTDVQFVTLMEKTEGFESQSSDTYEGDTELVYKNFKSYDAITLADNDVQAFSFGGTSGGIIVITNQATSTVNAMVSFRVGSSPFCASLSDGGSVSVGTGVLTQGIADGVNGNLNIHSATDNKLYVKNMIGGNLTFSVTFIGCQDRYASEIL